MHYRQGLSHLGNNMRIVKINFEGDFSDFITTHVLCAEDSAPAPEEVMRLLNTRYVSKGDTRFSFYKRDIEEKQIVKAFMDSGYVLVQPCNVNLCSDNIFNEIGELL